jgi:hypothetical protein
VYIRRAKIYIKEQEFDRALEDINSAKMIIYSDEFGEDMRENYLAILGQVKESLLHRKGFYEVRSWFSSFLTTLQIRKRKMEERMGSGFLESEVSETSPFENDDTESSNGEDFVFLGNEEHKLRDFVDQQLNY